MSTTLWRDFQKDAEQFAFSHNRLITFGHSSHPTVIQLPLRSASCKILQPRLTGTAPAAPRIQQRQQQLCRQLSKARPSLAWPSAAASASDTTHPPETWPTHASAPPRGPAGDAARLPTARGKRLRRQHQPAADCRQLQGHHIPSAGRVEHSRDRLRESPRPQRQHAVSFSPPVAHAHQRRTT